jgi:hypothetical protein
MFDGRNENQSKLMKVKPHLFDKSWRVAAFDPGCWVSFVFFGQGVCAVAFSLMVKIPREEVFVPIMVLFLGGIASTLFCLFRGSRHEGRGRWIIPAVFYALFITLMSNRSFPGVRPLFNSSYFHPVEFATLGLLLGNFWYWVIDEKGLGNFALRVFLAAGLFGIVDEIHQSFVPGRDPNIGDWILDLAGVSFSILIIVAIRYLVRSRVNSSPPPT